MFLTLLAATAVAAAQTPAGRITGSILDRSGGVIVRAEVKAINSETGTTLVEKTGASGGYVLYPLPPGLYSLSAEAPGFRTERVENIAVEVASTQSLDLKLEVSDNQREVLVVSAASAPLVSESPSLESTIVRAQIEALPLNSRDFNQLVLLAAGAVENAPSQDFGAVALNGNRAYGNSYLLDGVPNQNPFTNSSASAVSVDVIREFKVTSGAAPAEYGQAGSQVTIVTRSGGNQFHGSAFEYHRGNTWQATNPFNPGVIQPFRRNQFGGSLGGPVIRNKTFFFGNYEGNRQAQSAPIVATMPLDAFWKGDFSALLARKISVKDPLNGTVFPGNVIPASRLSPIALALHPYWSSPTLPGYNNNFIANGSTGNHADQFTTRADQTLPRGQNLSLRFTQANSTAASPSLMGNASGINTIGLSDNAGLNWSSVPTPTLINEFRMGYTDYHVLTSYLPRGLPTGSQVGIAGVGPAVSGTMPLPAIIFTGTDTVTRLAYNSSNAYSTVNQGSKLLDFSDAVTIVLGKHTIKSGFDYQRSILPAILQPASSGSITFTGNTTATSTGYTFAGFLLGIPASSVQVLQAPSLILQQHELAAYIQDDWRVAHNLTLSFGLRNEMVPYPTERKDRLALFDPVTGAIVVASKQGMLPTDQYSPLLVAKLANAIGQLPFPILSDRQAGFEPGSLVKPRNINLGPRFGFSYDLGTGYPFIVRGGYGMFYSPYPVQNLLQVLGINPPFSGSFSYSNSIKNGVSAITLANPFGGAASASISPSGIAPNFKLANNQQWNLALERELGWGVVASIGYIGNKGTNLFRAYNANQQQINGTTGAVTYPLQSTYGTAAISERTSDANSIYHAMQTIIRRRIGKGVTMEFNWTWAKGLDDVGNSLSISALDVQNLGRDRADSDYVRRHTVHFNATYALPAGHGEAYLSSLPKWADSLVGGWRLSGIWSYYTGRRFTPIINNTGLAATRPNVVYGVQANLPAAERSPSMWFNPAAFVSPPMICGPLGNSPCIGNAGRNILVGPGLDVVDLSLSKTVSIRERKRLTFRMEVFNAFNHPNYDLPDANLSNSTVGIITGLLKDMREAQFALRFDF
jgi:hypothetical protein